MLTLKHLIELLSLFNHWEGPSKEKLSARHYSDGYSIK